MPASLAAPRFPSTLLPAPVRRWLEAASPSAAPADEEPAILRRAAEAPGRIVLAGRGKVVALQPDEPVAVHCVAGTLWLTVEGDFEDYVLEAGTSRRLEPGDDAVIVAMPAAVLALQAA